MNAEQERRLRAWLASRDPGDASAALHAAVAVVPHTMHRAAYPAFDAAMTRLFGPSAAARPVLLIVVILALVLAVVAAGLILRSQRPFPPRGLIAFASPNGMDVWMVTADGSVNRPVTTTPLVLEHAPRWSPDGRTLLYVRHSNPGLVDPCGAQGSIALYDLATETERTIAPGARPILRAEWSPSGGEIAFLRLAPDCSSLEQALVDAATGSVSISPKRLPGREWILRWSGESPTAIEFVGAELVSPTGRYSVELGPPGREAAGHVTVRERDTGAVVDLGVGTQPAWSPDGTALAFVELTDAPPEYEITYRDRLVVASAASWQIRSLADVLDPAVSGPDDLSVIFPVFWTHDGRSIYWIDTRGGHVIDVASGRSLDLPKVAAGCSDLQWQPLLEPS